MGRAMVCGDAMHGTGETQECPTVEIHSPKDKGQEPASREFGSSFRINNDRNKEMGPGAGIEPTSEEPQSPMLPLHHPGHGLFPSRERNHAEWICLISLFMEIPTVLHKPLFVDSTQRTETGKDER